MMLRSSSTPVLGSLIPSFSESPNNINHHQYYSDHQFHSTQTPPIRRRLSCCTNNNGGGSQIFGKSLFQHSPSVAEVKETSNNRSSLIIRRAQSEGNLKELAADDASLHDVDEFIFSKKTPNKNKPTLETIPSFSISNFGVQGSGDDEESDDEEDLKLEIDGSFEVENLVSDKMGRGLNYYDYRSRFVADHQGKMYLATGLCISGRADLIDGGGGFGGGARPVTFDMGGGESGDGGLRLMEQHYKKMVEENNGNSLVLRNYAQFLYQRKGDVERAEEYYSRAILADPQDGEVLSQHAKIIWEVHRDKERARNYFERAIRDSSQDSHIHAAYAGFLWDIADEEDETSEESPLLHNGFMASATATG